MANSLETKFKFDDRDGAKVDALRGKLEGLNDLLNRAANNKNFGLNPTFGGNTNLSAPSAKPIDSELAKAKAAVADFEKTRLLLNKSSLAEIERGEKALTKIKIGEAKARNEAEIRAIRERERSEKLGGRSGTGGFGDSFGSRVFGSDFGSAAFLGGAAGGAVVAGVGLVKEAVSSLIGEVKDLSVASVKLAANFEETTNSVAVFAGSTSAARQELKAIDKVALNTPGLRLQDAEIGYQRLRALGFQAKISQDLIKGLGTQRVLSGASSDAVDRVITNLIQLKSGAGTAADVRQTVGQLPTLLPVFQKAFGTQDFGDINKIFKTDPQALQKFSDELAKAQTAQAGLNVTIEKGSDAVIQAGRAFGEPFLQPLTRDVRDLTTYLNQNEATIKSWGQSAADVLNGVSQTARGLSGAEGGLGKFARGVLGISTFGISEGAIGVASGLEKFGKQAREKAEAEDQQKRFTELFTNGADVKGVQVVFDKLTNTFKGLPSVAGKLELDKAAKQTEETDRAAKELKKTLADLSALPLKFALDDVSQNLEIQKAIAVRDAKGDGLKFARLTADLEINALREQIALSDRLSANKIQNLSPDDAAAGRGLVVAQENAANRAKLESQIVLTRINAQKQQTEEARKLKDEFRDSFVSLKSADNPLLKQMSDLGLVTERAQKKFGAFGDEVVNKIAAIERANLTKAINLQKFDNNLAGLKFDQDARRLAATPERQFADFARKLELVNRKVELVSTNNDLTRKISEAEYYATKFNPNNPKNFAEYNRRGANDDVSDAGIQIRNAVSDIRDLKNIGLEGTGLDGKEAVINKILEAIPPRDELLRRLSSPNLRGDSQNLLEEQAQALRIKKDIERNKFNNFLEDQRTAEFGKVFAREQIGLINKSGLTDLEKAQQRLTVTNALGNDLDPALKRQAIQDSVASANERRNRETEALQISKDVRTAVQSIVAALAGQGIKIDASGMPAPQVSVALNGVEATVSNNPLPSSATLADTAEAYFDPNSLNYKIGDVHKAGALYGLTK